MPFGKNGVKVVPNKKSDAPTMSDAWTTYREALRNLPSTESDPADIVFPTEPT